MPPNRQELTLEAEQQVLGTCLLNPEKIAEIELTPEMFLRPVHQQVWRVMRRLDLEGKATDYVAVVQAAKSEETPNPEITASYLGDLMNRVPTDVGLEHRVKMVRDGYLARKYTAILRDSMERLETTDDVPNFLDSVQQELFALSQTGKSDEVMPFIDALDERFIEYGKEASDSISTGFYQLDSMLSGLQREDLYIIAGRPSMGKCLPGETFVDDPRTGERVTLRDFVEQKRNRILGISEQGRVRETEVADWVDSRIQPCYRVRTRLGREVEVTPHHPFLTIWGWRPLNTLKLGTKIAVPREVPCFGSEDVDRDLARMVGYLIAEGGLTHGTPAFTNTDPIIVEDLRDIVARKFPDCHLVPNCGITYRLSQKRRTKKNPITAWLEELGLMGKLSKDKFVPAALWRWNRASLAEFLRALMSCDGSIYTSGSQTFIEFTVASERLARDVHHLLVRFGIVSKFHKKCEGAWRVVITNPSDISRYQSEMGWIGGKAARSCNIPAKGKPVRGNLPKEAWSVVQVGLQTRGISAIELGRRCGETTKRGHGTGYNPHMKRTLPRYRAEKYAKELDSEHLQWLASPDLYWDDIVEIAYVGEKQVYDLTVSDGANFIAQDVLVHNTSLARTIVRNVARQRIPVLFFSAESGRRQQIDALFAAEAKINSTILRNRLAKDSPLWPKVTEALGKLVNLPILIDDKPYMTAAHIRAKARRQKAKDPNLGLVVVDYIQYLADAEEDRRETKDIRVGNKALAMKNLARELRIPVILLSQLSRAVEQRDDKRPNLSDLRESGLIEAHADTVMFLYRECYYHPEKKPPNGQPEITEVIVSKQRNGPTGMVPLAFIGDYATFQNVETRRPEPPPVRGKEKPKSPW